MAIFRLNNSLQIIYIENIFNFINKCVWSLIIFLTVYNHKIGTGGASFKKIHL